MCEENLEDDELQMLDREMNISGMTIKRKAQELSKRMEDDERMG